VSAIISFPCGFCGAAAGQPCTSVGRRPITEPHMKRIEAAGAIGADAVGSRDAYARAVVSRVFGHCSDELLQRAKKDRSIDERKPWVRRALEIHPEREGLL
jgi:hypothetical protein